MGTLKMARRLSYPEFIALASDIRLGAALGFFSIDINTVTEMIHTLADGNVITSKGCDENPELAQRFRADEVRSRL